MSDINSGVDRRALLEGVAMAAATAAATGASTGALAEDSPAAPRQKGTPRRWQGWRG
jgi:hypothetical protein